MTATLVLVAILFLLAVAITFFLSRGAPEPPVAAKPPSASIAHLPPQFVVFDLETMGLRPAVDEIIEIGAIRITRHSSLQMLVRPANPIPRQISHLTGISQAMVDSDGIALKEAIDSFVEFIGDLPLVSYNAKFDMAFLEQSARRCNVVIKNPATCALEMTRRAWPRRESYRLADVAGDGGMSVDDSHRALGDCRRTASVYACAALKLKSDAPPSP